MYDFTHNCHPVGVKGNLSLLDILVVNLGGETEAANCRVLEAAVSRFPPKGELSVGQARKWPRNGHLGIPCLRLPSCSLSQQKVTFCSGSNLGEDRRMSANWARVPGVKPSNPKPAAWNGERQLSIDCRPWDPFKGFLWNGCRLRPSSVKSTAKAALH